MFVKKNETEKNILCLMDFAWMILSIILFMFESRHSYTYYYNRSNSHIIIGSHS